MKRTALPGLHPSSPSLHPFRSAYDRLPMSWIVEDRRNKRLASDQPLVTDEMRRHVTDVLMPRYPTKRACLLPALHLVQHEYGWIPPEALAEVGDLLGLAPAEVLDTATFYEEYWLKRKGKYLVQVCRSLACEVCGSDSLTRGLSEKLDIEVGETTDDQRFTLVELECLGSCGTAPVAMINEVLLEDATLEGVSRTLDTLPDDPHHYGDPTVDFDVPTGTPPHGTFADTAGGSSNGRTSPAAPAGAVSGLESRKIAATGQTEPAAQSTGAKNAPAGESASSDEPGSPQPEPAKSGTTGATSPGNGKKPGKTTIRQGKRGGKKAAKKSAKKKGSKKGPSDAGS